MQIKTILISALTSLIVGVVVYFLATHDHKKLAVVDAVKLVNSYRMKTDMEAADKGELLRIKSYSDSLGQAWQQAEKLGISPAEKQSLEQQIRYSEQVMGQAYEQSNARINEAVWKRLNPLIDQYSKEQGFHLVIGANGMGSVLYNDDTYDHTEELIKFVNKAYDPHP